MDRRQFLLTAAGALGLSAYDLRGQTTGARSPRVGIIGPGWYGKTDLWHSDPVHDRQMLSKFTRK